MEANEMVNFFNLVYSTLLNYCRMWPYDTGNMYSNILVAETEDYWEITISAPKGSGDYAKAVNEGLLAKAQGRPLSQAEAENYHWIEKALLRATEVYNGKGVTINDI